MSDWYIFFLIFDTDILINPSSAVARILQEDWLSAMAADALAPWLVMTYLTKEVNPSLAISMAV